MKLFMTYAVQHTLGSRILIKIASQEKFRAWLEKTEVNGHAVRVKLINSPLFFSPYNIHLV